jgi:hypothetical protein
MYNGRREIWRWTPFSSKVMGNESLSRKSGPAAYFRPCAAFGVRTGLHVIDKGPQFWRHLPMPGIVKKHAGVMGTQALGEDRELAGAPGAFLVAVISP